MLVYTNLALNGLIVFHRQSAAEREGRFNFLSSQSKLDGQGRLEFENSNRFNQIKAGLEDSGEFLTIGSNITIHGQGLTIGNIAGADSGQPPFVENRGTILTQPGDYLNFGTYSFTNAGVIQIAGSNVVNAYFNFTQTSGGRLEFEVSNSATGPVNGKLNIPGAAALDGTLSLNFQPQSSDSFELLTYKSHTGTFSTIMTPPTPPGSRWTADYGATGFRLNLQ